MSFRTTVSLLLGTVCIASFDRDNFWTAGISGISQDARKRVSHSSDSSGELLNGRARIASRSDSGGSRTEATIDTKDVL